MLRAISAKNLDLIPTEEEESTIGETGRLLFSIPRIGPGLSGGMIYLLSLGKFKASRVDNFLKAF